MARAAAGWLSGGTLNRYLGLTLRLSREVAAGVSRSAAGPMMKDAMREWGDSGVRSVLVTLPGSAADLIPALQSSAPSLSLHHCNAHDNTITLAAWLDPDTPSKIPAYASSSVGCGGVVVNEDREILVVREHGDLRSDAAAAQPSPWKLPGGAADVGEDLESAAVREVFEETGIETQPGGLVAVRHLDDLRFGLGDVYFVFRLTPLGSLLTPCPDEIHDAKWMPVDEWMASVDSPLNSAIARAVVEDTLHPWHASHVSRPGQRALVYMP